MYLLINDELVEIEASLWSQNIINQEYLLRHLAVPIKIEDGFLIVALEKENVTATDFFAFLYTMPVKSVIITNQQLKHLLEGLTPQNKPNQIILNDFEHNEFDGYSVNEDNNQDEPIIRLLENIFENALQQRASDLHFEPIKQGAILRIRVDGVLSQVQNFTPAIAKRIISRLKLLAKVDISETRRPQDGSFIFTTKLNDRLDFRLSSIPCLYGEKIVLRLQSNTPLATDFSKLGMNDKQVEIFKRCLAQPQGLILVSGPTGSGKSISLYSALNYLNHNDKNIVTAEDPIEIKLDGIIQSEINESIGLDFNTLLRAFLRQDPDIIMLGEIRDEKSANMAIKAAQTGHLVLSTIHTNDAPSAITRLKSLGVDEFSLKSSLLLVFSQRLIRKCCTKCGGNHSDKCDCNNGYHGRIGCFQFLYPYAKADNSIEFKLDFATIFDNAKLKVEQNISDKSELMRTFGRYE